MYNRGPRSWHGVQVETIIQPNGIITLRPTEKMEYLIRPRLNLEAYCPGRSSYGCAAAGHLRVKRPDSTAVSLLFLQLKNYK
jgi:hypothetical protein